MEAPTPVSLGKFQIMPLMTEEQFQELKNDIKQHGVLVPIEFDQHGRIVDGHHRWRAFNELIQEGADVPMYDRIVRTFESEDDEIRYVLSLNLKRRHLTQKQRAEIVATLRRPPFNYTLQKIADTLGVSPSTIWWDIDSLDDETKAELKALTSRGADGRAMPASYMLAPRTFQTGNTQLREMMITAAKEIGERLRQQPVPTEALNGTSPEHTPVISTQGVTGTGQGEAPPEGELRIVVSEPESNGKPRTDMPVAEAVQRMTAFAWYGGKSSHLTWLLQLLPPCKHFVDVFGGSAAVLLNRERSPIETYNDLDANITNFFKVLREQPDELARLLYLTPFGRGERREAFEAIIKQDGANLTPLERARQFFVLARQSRSGVVQKEIGMINSWKLNRDVIQRGMGANISQWESGIDGLAAVASRLKYVQIENYDWSRVITLYDSPETLFYCDPPYAHVSRTIGHTNEYKFEMTDADHTRLAEQLHNVKGRVALSGYPSELYDKLYGDWQHIAMPTMATAGYNDTSIADAERIEMLWTNYPLR